MSVFDALKAVFVGIARAFAFARVALANLLILAILVLGIVLLFAGPDPVEVPDGGALVVSPGGTIVEQAGAQDPILLLTGGVQGQTVLAELLDGIDKARGDDRISTLVLDVSSLGYVAPAQLEVLGAALETFRGNEGKTIIAKSRFYGRDQYYLASFADEIYVHPMGDVMPTGYGMFRNYYQAFSTTSMSTCTCSASAPTRSSSSPTREPTCRPWPGKPTRLSWTACGRVT